VRARGPARVKAAGEELRALRLRRAAGRVLVALYPEAWRERYRSEVLGLIDDDPPSVGGLASLLLGAGDAHLHPQRSWRHEISPLARVRLSVGAIFCCWIALSLQGASFQKLTEDQPFAGVEAHHRLLAAAHDAILAGALLGAGAIALAGLPLLWQALAQVRAERDWRLAAMLCLPLLAVGCFGAETWLLLAVAPARDGGFPATFVLGAGLPFVLGAIACALVCALTPRMVLRRIGASRRLLRRAALASIPLVLAMCVITVGLTVYEISLSLQAPGAAGAGNGPLGNSTQATLAVGCALATIATGLALLGSTRARRAAREAA
jgi:hypothetical protein